MKFCPDCGGKLRLNPTKGNTNSNRIEYGCPNCGYSAINSSQPVQSLTAQASPVQETIVVIDEETTQLRTLPTTKTECPKCQNNVAYFWQVQTRSADEGSTQFFRCTTCHHTWRLYT
jgi:DNA-directed RNA polymerase subunit M